MAIFIDGSFAGRTDEDGQLAVSGVGIGTHRVRAEDASGSVGEGDFDFADDVNLVLVPVQGVGRLGSTPKEVPRARREIDFKIDTNVPQARVLVDGRHVGTTSAQDGNLVLRLVDGASLDISIQRDGFVAETRRVQVAEVPNFAQFRLRTSGPATPASGQELSKKGRNQLPAIFIALVAVAVLAAAGALIYTMWTKRTEVESDPASEATSSGTPVSFDRYRVQGVLGQGGVATIYRAIDATDGSAVALKVLDPKWMADPEMVQKFLAEASALEALHRLDQSAPIVRMHRSGREGDRINGCPFIALELLEGETIEQRLRRAGPFSELESAGIGAQVARALSLVHRAGIVHRDLTPDNIFLVPGEVRIGSRVVRGAPRVVVIDFGVARQEFLSRVTMDGSIAGKPPYMSPEQCSGARIDFRSDLYALGILLYAMATGRPPFDGKNPFEVMRAHQHSPVPALSGNYSVELRNLVAHLLEKDPTERPGAADLVAARLESRFEELWRVPVPS
ncbi:MAG: serine/threonine protein kinase [Thermoanaerobaculia bacterium]|nr:serine/threonine protein kinase [Thermoanaerobaculia bacterium]